MTTYSPATTDQFHSMLAGSTGVDIIELRDDVGYGNLTIPSTTAQGVTITAETPQVATCARLIINGAQNITIDGVKVQIADIPGGSGDARVWSAIRATGNCDGLHIENVLARCGYQPDSFAEFDVTADHTTYPEFGAPGGDSTYNKLANTYPYGFGSDGSFSGDLTIQDCIFEDLSSAVKFAGAGGVDYKFRRILMRRIYQDYFSFGFPGGEFTPISNIEITGCTFADNFAQPQDNNNPHGDYVQIFSRDVGSGDSETPVAKLLIAGCIGYMRPGVRGQAQRIFLSDTPIGFPFVGPKIIENLLISASSDKGITIVSHAHSGSAGSYVYRNTLAANPENNIINGNAGTANPNTAFGGPNIPAGVISAATIRIRSDDDYQSQEFAQKNFTEAFASELFNDARSENIEIGTGSVSNKYTTWFDGPADWDDVDTADAVVDAFTPKTAFQDYGAVRPTDTDAATFLAKWSGDVKPWSTTPAYVGFRGQYNVEKSTVINSNWGFVHAQNDTLAIEIEGGEYRIADDFEGTGAGSWTSAPGTVTDGQYLQVRTTSSALDVTQSHVVVTIGTDEITWTITTKSDVEYPLVTFDGTQIIRASSGVSHGADSTKMTFAMLFDGDPSASSEFIISQSTGTSRLVRVQQFLSTGRLRILLYNASATAIASIDTENSIVTGVGLVEVLFTADMTQETAEDGFKLWINGTERTFTANTWVQDGSIGFSYTGTSRQQIGGNSTIAQANCELAMIWMDRNVIVDIADPLVRANFSAGRIGPNGEGITGNQPVLFLVGESADWNSDDGAQRGTGPKYTKADGNGVNVTAANAAVWPPVLSTVLEAVTPEPHIAGDPITLRYRPLGYATADAFVELLGTGSSVFSANPVECPDGFDGIEFDYTPDAPGTHTISAEPNNGYSVPTPLVLSVTDGGDAVAPTVSTTAISAITPTSAASGGNVTSDGGASVTARGICWATTSTPTTANNVISAGTGTGSFTSAITGLTASTLYYVRAFATNAEGTSYGSQQSFTTGPIVSSATINTGGTTLTVNASGALTNSTGFSISGLTPAAGITYASGSGSTALVFTLSRTLLAGETLTLSYTPGNVVDGAGNALAAFTGTTVTNNSTEVPATDVKVVRDRPIDYVRRYDPCILPVFTTNADGEGTWPDDDPEPADIRIYRNGVAYGLSSAAIARMSDIVGGFNLTVTRTYEEVGDHFRIVVPYAVATQEYLAICEMRVTVADILSVSVNDSYSASSLGELVLDLYGKTQAIDANVAADALVGENIQDYVVQIHENVIDVSGLQSVQGAQNTARFDDLDEAVAAVKAKTDLIGGGTDFTGSGSNSATNGSITAIVGELKSVSIPCSKDVSAASLTFMVETRQKADVDIVANASITKSGSTASLTLTAPMTFTERTLRWSLFITSTQEVVASGLLFCTYDAQED